MKMDEKTGQDYIREFCGLTEEPEITGTSEITNFYDDCNILITGGSGFMGKLLIEKFLRCCPDMGTLFILMRVKKGKSVEERFKEHFEDSLYETLKRERPGFQDKVMVIEGDTGVSDLGISEENRKLLVDKVHVVFHGAANVRFDEKLRRIVETNIRGTKLMFSFAKEMKNLKAFVHISTAFAHCPNKFIDEEYYPTPIDGDQVLDLIEILDDAALELITPMLLGEYPNTYAFSKAVAEGTVRKYGSDIPTCIVRPSIVISTSWEPTPGWTNNLYGATGVVVGAGIGLLRTLHCEKNYVADIIPADYVTSNIVAAAWDTAKTWEEEKRKKELDQDVESYKADPVIFNSVSSCQNPITWERFMNLNATYGMDIPSKLAIWTYFFTLNRHLWVHNFYVLFLHVVPAIFADTACILTGRKPMLLKTYKKIHKFSFVISYFCTQMWRFKNNNVVTLWDKLNEIDKIKYNFNVITLDWDHYFQRHIRGLRLYLIKDPLETIEEGKIHTGRLKIAHYTLVTLFFASMAWIAMKLLMFISAQFYVLCF